MLGAKRTPWRLSLAVHHVILLILVVILVVFVVTLKAYEIGMRHEQPADTFVENSEQASGSKVRQTTDRFSADDSGAGHEQQQDDDDDDDLLDELSEEMLSGVKGPMNELLDAVNEMRDEALNTMPYNRLQFHRSIDRSNTIFVAIPNPDPETCTELVNSIYDNAKNKFSIRVGLVEHSEDTDEVDRDVIFHFSKCVDIKYTYCNQSRFCPPDYIRTRRVPQSELNHLGRGLSWRKYLSTNMYRNEQYVLMVDGAVTQFTPHWDAKLISDFEERLDQAELSPHHLALSGRLPTASTNAFTPVCIDQLDSDGLPLLTIPSSRSTSRHNLPRPQLLASTEFLFGTGYGLLTSVPFDRYLYNLSSGALDLLTSARLHAAGFTVFLPSEPSIKATSSIHLTAATQQRRASNDKTTGCDADDIARFHDHFFNPGNIIDSRYRIAGDQGVPAGFLESLGLTAVKNKEKDEYGLNVRSSSRDQSLCATGH